MAQYYTLEEAATILQVTPDKVREMVRQGKLRGFQDKGTLRFRANDIDEMARSLGLGSDPELPLSEPTEEKQPSSSGKRKKPPTPTVEEESGKKPAGGRKPTMVKPPVGSDSDVRLVVDDFSLEDEPTPSSSRSEKKSDKKPAKPDSGLRLLPMDEDSDVKLVPDDEPASPASSARKNAGSKTPSDSDIRLSIEDEGSDAGYEPQVTEEIDLDSEEMQAASKHPRKKSELKQPQKSAGNKKSSGKLPTTSPFELSEDDVQLVPEDKPEPPASKKSAGKKSDSSKKQPAPMNLSLEDEELALTPEDDSEEIGLGLEVGDDDPGQSGINLQDPADSGPSLEDGSSDMDLSLNPAESGARSSKSGASKKDEDSSSDFELSLDEGGEEDGESSSSEFELSLEDSAEQEADSSSEFELTLDDDASSSSSSVDDSDSEFELTLDEDDAGVNLSPIGEEGEEPDIFETNLDVPALDDESGSEAVPLEGSEEMDEGSSEFELDLDGEEGDEESGSQVVPLDEDEADEGDETVARTAARGRGKPKGRALSDFGDDEEEASDEGGDYDYDEDTDADEDEDARPAAAGASAEAVPWGPLPVLMLLPTVIVLFVVGLMSYELVRGMWGFQKSTRVSQMVIKPIAEMFGDKLPD